jgi:hypothetical protein
METKEGARKRQELRRSNAAVPIPARKSRRSKAKLRKELDAYKR